MRFCANISTLCRDIPSLTERFAHIVTRKDFSFQSVECQDPYSVPLAEWQALNAQHPTVSWSLINSPYLFDVCPRGPLPGREEYEKLVLRKVIDYATGLRCEKVHLVMCDIADGRSEDEIVDLISFASRALQPSGISCVLEPLSTRPEYWLRSYKQGELIVNKLGDKNVKLLLDTYHMQMLDGNLTFNMQRVAPIAGHAQISQVPLRNSPVASGELDYSYVLKKLGESYDGVIGLEYFSNSDESFNWLNQYVS